MAAGTSRRRRQSAPTFSSSNEFIPQNLATTVVDPTIWKTGSRELELSPTDDAAWHAVWQEFKAGA